MNHNSAYVYIVDGNTIWERLRVIRNFLADRKKALALAEISFEQMLDQMESESNKYERMKLEIEIPDIESNIEDAKAEVKFLTSMENELSKIAELSRIQGKTDKEMYEINHFFEHEVRLANKAKSEILSENRIHPETILELVRCPKALVQVEETGLLQNAELFMAAFPEQKKMLELSNASGL